MGLMLLMAISSAAWAHVPYIERRDTNVYFPFDVQDVEQSIVIYAWIRFDGASPATDLDFYRFQIETPTLVHVESIVPVCPGYETFAPSFALIGPGLPAPAAPLPFPLPPAWGAIVMEDVAPGEPRETFFEPFGGKSYYQGPVLDEVVPAGTYYVVYWDPDQAGGDYGAVIGLEERFGFWDIVRAIIEVPRIRRDEELHVPCD